MAVYLDYNATTPLDERVLEAMLPYLRTHYGNPSSLHRQGRVVRAAIDRAREQVAAAVNAHPSQVIFTSGGTEANNLAIKGGAAPFAPGRLVVSAIEHTSVLKPAQALTRAGWALGLAAVDEHGYVTPDAVRRACGDGARLISVMQANNETGVIQDSAGIGAVAREAGALFHVDAVQALGKMAVDYADSGAHLMSLSAHKLYGPKGVGALVYDRSIDLEAQMLGSGHEMDLRSGTENVAGIIGFGAAAELTDREWRDHAALIGRLREYLEDRLRQLPGVVIFCEHARRLPNTVFIALAGIDGEALKMHLDRDGIAISSGSACTSASAEPSHVLRAMGVEDRVAQGAVRISLSHHNTQQDLDILVETLKRHLAELDSGSLLAWG